MDIWPDMDYTKMLTTYSPCILMIAISFNAIILISLSEVQPNIHPNRIFGTTNICIKYKAHNIKRIRSYSQVAHYFRRRTSYNNNDLTGYSARYSAGYSARYRDHTHSFSRWHWWLPSSLVQLSSIVCHKSSQLSFQTGYLDEMVRM